MADKSAIEWTDATWNPIVGCSIVSPGCTNCYAMKMARRIEAMNGAAGVRTHYRGTTLKRKSGAVWTGHVAMAPDKTLTQPLRWREPRRIFVNSMGDLFHESIPDEWIDRVFAVMALSPQHRFQVLTKRADRMREYLSTAFEKGGAFDRIVIEMMRHTDAGVPTIKDSCKRHGIAWQKPWTAHDWWPLRNVWLGVSTERQQEADERIPLLLQTPAAVRFISAEPLLGPIDLNAVTVRGVMEGNFDIDAVGRRDLPHLDWVIVGGESGHGARAMHPQWARDLRDQCAEAGVPFFFKQWGEWAPSTPEAAAGNPRSGWRTLKAHPHVAKSEELYPEAGAAFIEHVGKKSAGRLLDGFEHSAFPQAKEVAVA